MKLPRSLMVFLALDMVSNARSSSMDEILLESIRHFDSIAVSYSATVSYQSEVYVDWSTGNTTDPSGKPFRSRSTSWGRYFAKGKLKAYTKHIVLDGADHTTNEEGFFDGENVILVFHRGIENPTAGKVVYQPLTDTPFKPLEFDPMYWAGFFGTKLTALLSEDPSVSSVKMEPIVYDGAECLVITVIRRQNENQIRIIVDPEKGYRPVETQYFYENGQHATVTNDLHRYADNIWYPQTTRVRAWRPAKTSGSSEELIMEKRIDFRDFRANEDIPLDRFQIPTRILDSPEYVKFDQR